MPSHQATNRHEYAEHIINNMICYLFVIFSLKDKLVHLEKLDNLLRLAKGCFTLWLWSATYQLSYHHSSKTERNTSCLLLSHNHIHTCHVSRLLRIQGYKQVCSKYVHFLLQSSNSIALWPIPRYNITSYVVSYFAKKSSETQTSLISGSLVPLLRSMSITLHHICHDDEMGKVDSQVCIFLCLRSPQSCVSGEQVDKVSTWL